MLYVIYHTESLSVIKTFKYAKSATKFLGKMGAGYTMTDIDTYKSLEVPMKKVKNLMTGEEMEIPVNTPLVCDPSRETYWSF